MLNEVCGTCLFSVGITTRGDKNEIRPRNNSGIIYINHNNNNRNVGETKPNHDGRHNGNSTTPDFFHRFIGG